VSLYLFVLLGCGWWFFSLSRRWDLRALPPFDRVVAESAPLTTLPRVSIVVPARNEELRVEETIRRLLAQQQIDLQLIVVNDRSTDRTGEILERLAEEDDRLTLVQIEELPSDWLGKCHACARAAERATGDWILFTDADTWLAPDLLARAVRVAEARAASLLCLFPNQQIRGVIGRAAVLAFSLGFVAFAARANRDRKRAPVGIGAFNLVRRSAYESCGGYKALKLEVIDDMKLGLLIQRDGGRLRCYGAPDDLEIDWARSAGGLTQALEKNFFAMVQFSYPLSFLITLLLSSMWALGMIAPFRNDWAGWFAFSGFLSTAIPALPLARHSGWGLLSALMTPFVYLVIPITLARSTWATWRQGGVRWRETHYPIKLLRKHQVRLF